MKFITFQPSFPSKDRLVFNESLGFYPVWAIPVTTFKDTMTSLLTIAASNPKRLFVFETDSYKCIDKFSYFQHMVKNNGILKNSYIPTINSLDNVFPNECCLDVDKLGDSLFESRILSVLGLRSDIYSLDQLLGFPISNSVDRKKLIDDFYLHTQSLDKHIYHENGMLVGNLLNSKQTPFFYNLTVLPIFVSILCEDKKIDLASFCENYCFLVSCLQCTNILVKNIRSFALMSEVGDFTSSDYLSRVKNISNLIVDSKSVLKRLVDNDSIGRNELCPCGSGIKFKKCHGRYIS